MGRLQRLLFEDKQEWIGPRVWHFLVANPSLLVPMLYILISGTGLLYQYLLFSRFGINVLDYAHAKDFLLVAFKTPAAFNASVLIAGSLVFYRVVVNYARKKKEHHCAFLLATALVSGQRDVVDLVD